jgi:hypothetical protein
MEKPARKPAPPKQWRLRQPVSKADHDAVREFKRAAARRDHLIGELKQADARIQETFAELQRRGQVEEGGPKK